MINLFGLLGNTLVLSCVLTSPRLKSLTFKLFGFLAVVDLIANSQFILMAISLHLNVSFANILPDPITYVTIIVYSVSSVYMIVAMSFHHFVGFKSAM